MKNAFRKYDVDWEKENENFKNSGQSMSQFCADKEYNKGIFAYHYYRKKNSDNAAVKQPDSGTLFLPVEIAERHISVITVNGYRITVTDHTDISALRTVLKAIGDISWN